VSKKKKDDVNALRTGREFVDYAKRHGAEVFPSKGGHVKIRTKKGLVVVPNHPGDLATGTRRAIVKAFIMIGIALLFVTLMLSWML
jgi:predicted RNA binding protein YcfA (HicA-like mRNA interferase family)